MSEFWDYDDNQEYLAKAVVEYLLAKGHERGARLFLNCRSIRLSPETGADIDEYTNRSISVTVLRVTLLFPPRLLDKANEALSVERAALEEALQKAVYGLTDRAYDQFWIETAMTVERPAETWRDEIVKRLLGKEQLTNQARVSGAIRQPPFSWNGLGFQSETETRIARALSEAHVLFFPLPAAVAGVQKKEPDFLVCADGKWGILEVQGDEFHPPKTAAKEHERGRWFQSYGVRVFQIYSATQCYSNPDEVVSEFLKLLRASG